MKKLWLSTAITLITASPALADLTPAALWQSWQEDFANLGLTVSADVAQEGDDLLLEHVVLEFVSHDIRLSQEIAQLRLVALPDGSVRMEQSPDVTMRVGGFIFDRIEELVRFDISLEGAESLISGSVDDYTIAFSAQEMTLTSMVEPKNSNSSTAIFASFTGIEGAQHVVHGQEGVTLGYRFSTDTVENTQINTSSLAGDQIMTQNTRSIARDYRGDFTMFFPAPREGWQGGSLIPEGFSLEGDISLQSSEMTQSTETPYFKMKVSVEEARPSYHISLNDEGVAMDVASHDASIRLDSPALPAKLAFSLPESSLHMSFPLRPGDSPQQARFALSLTGLEANDAVWNMADPEGQLSRAPVDLLIDTSAEVSLLLDWTNPDAVKDMQGPPITLHSATLREFLISFENARLTGQGEVGFNNDGPAPVPDSGQLTFELDGVLALLDKLGTLPMVPASAMAGAKGMLGVLFPGANDGADRLTPHIEFSAGGHISVNGLQLR